MKRTCRRKSPALVGITLIALLVLALCGCGDGSDQAPDTARAPAKNGAFPDGAAAEYYQETGQMKTTTAVKEVSVDELGVPVYPGAKLEGGTVQVETETCPVGVLKTTQAVLVTPDPVDKVSEWYKGEMSSEQGFEDHSYSQDGSVHGMYWVPTENGSQNIIVEKNMDGSGTKITTIVQKEKTG